MPAITAESLVDKSTMEAWIAQLSERIENLKTAGSTMTFSVEEDKELNVWLPKVTIISHGVDSHYRWSADFFSTTNYGKIVSLGSKLQGLIEEGAFIQKGSASVRLTLLKRR